MDDLRYLREHLTALGQGRRRRLGQHAVECLASLGVLRLHVAHHVAQILAVQCLGRHVEYATSVPKRDVLLDVVQYGGDEHRREDWVHAEGRRHHVRHVRLQVSQMVLVRECRDRSTERRRDVLVHCVLLARLHCGVEQILGVRHLQRLEDTLLDLAHVVHAGDGGRALRHCLHLRVALRLGEDVRVADWHDVKHAVKVIAPCKLVACLLLKLLVVEVEAVETVEDAQHAAHCVMQTAVDRGVDDCALLQLGERRADRCVRVVVGDVLHRRTYDALGRVDQEA